MNTKKCSGCGWEYPIEYDEAKCRFCGTYFRIRRCRKCGEIKEIHLSRMCKSCYNLYIDEKGYNRQVNYNERARAVRDYEEWIKRLKATPQHFLTEAEWIEACRYFKSCALCPTDSIDARMYFIQFQDGGRYTATNILPVCEKCATEIKKQPNVFLCMVYRNKNQDKEKFKNALEYLQSRMEVSRNEQQET